MAEPSASHGITYNLIDIGGKMSLSKYCPLYHSVNRLHLIFHKYTQSVSSTFHQKLSVLAWGASSTGKMSAVQMLSTWAPSPRPK